MFALPWTLRSSSSAWRNLWMHIHACYPKGQACASRMQTSVRTRFPTLLGCDFTPSLLVFFILVTKHFSHSYPGPWVSRESFADHPIYPCHISIRLPSLVFEYLFVKRACLASCPLDAAFIHPWLSNRRILILSHALFVNYFWPFLLLDQRHIFWSSAG